MIRDDSIGRALLAEYLTPMPNQNVSGDEARALFEYFRQVGGTNSSGSTPGTEGRTAGSGDQDGS